MTARSGEQQAHEAMARPGRQMAATPRLRLLFTGVWLVYLIGPVAGLFRHNYDPGRIALGLGVVAAFCAVYFAMVLTGGRVTRPAWHWYGLVALFVLAAVASAGFGPARWNAMWIYVSAASGLVPRSWRMALVAVAATAACYVGFSIAGHDAPSDYLFSVLPVAMIGIIMMGGKRQGVLMLQLTRARETVARMAASQERLRLARDMHDLTGQSLSTITLKSELAARLLTRLPDSAERDRALEEIEQVAAVSRQTLSDIREAISGYRRPTLAVEVITARSALESAGIMPADDPELTLASGTFGPDEEAALAWCLREAVTNVIRHSGARNCRISLTRRSGTVSLSVRDDGSGSESAGGTGEGAGLRGMSERLSVVGGDLRLSPGADGFALTATVPAGQRVTVTS